MKQNKLQIELWEECNAKCPFCYASRYGVKTQDKRQHIIDSIALLDELDVCEVSLIGGEFFDGQIPPDLCEDFIRLIDKLNAMLNSGKLNSVLISTNLMHLCDRTDCLKLDDVLSRFSDLKKIHVCSSYDVEGRFKSEEIKQKWLEEVDRLKAEYPDLRLVVNIIATRAFTRAIKDGFNLNFLLNKFDWMCITVPSTSISTDFDSEFENKEKFERDTGLAFFPTRSEFLEILPILHEQVGDKVIKAMFDRQYHANLVAYWHDDELLLYPFNGDNRFGDRYTFNLNNGYLDNNEISMLEDTQDYCESAGI